MENYHLLIVDERSLKFHIEYGFVGTGKSSADFDITLWEDIARLKVGDKIIFYAQSLCKFFGIFEVASLPFFDNSNPQYLAQANPVINERSGDAPVTKTIELRYRALIRPYRVYENGISEFDLIDILPVSTKDVLWSILYRKLKGARGCSPLFPREFDIVASRLSTVNGDATINSLQYSFQDGQIVASAHNLNYQGNAENNINIKNHIIHTHVNNLRPRYQEHHLHALLIQRLPNRVFGNNILWSGNEVYSGAGTQAIDLMSINQIEDKDFYNIVEVKRDVINGNIANQILKYARWTTARFDIKNPQEVIQPVLIGARSTPMQKRNRSPFIVAYNNLNLSLPIRYFEYLISAEDDSIVFYETNLTSPPYEAIASFEI